MVKTQNVAYHLLVSREKAKPQTPWQLVRPRYWLLEQLGILENTWSRLVYPWATPHMPLCGQPALLLTTEGSKRSVNSSPWEWRFSRWNIAWEINLYVNLREWKDQILFAFIENRRLIWQVVWWHLCQADPSPAHYGSDSGQPFRP